MHQTNYQPVSNASAKSKKPSAQQSSRLHGRRQRLFADYYIAALSARGGCSCNLLLRRDRCCTTQSCMREARTIDCAVDDGDSEQISTRRGVSERCLVCATRNAGKAVRASWNCGTRGANFCAGFYKIDGLVVRVNVCIMRSDRSNELLCARSE